TSLVQVRFLLQGRKHFDILHAQTANTITWAALTRWRHKLPVVFSRRTDFQVENDAKTSFKWKRIDLFVAISESAAAEPRRLGFKPIIIRSAIEPAVIDQERVERFRSEWPLEGKRIIGT